MPIVPIRNIAKYGVLADPDPYDLPNEAWSMAVNVRFRSGHISGGPIFRDVWPLGTADPRFSVSSIPSIGTNLLITGYNNGRIYSFAGSETDISVGGYTSSVSDSLWSSVVLANVLYVNRADRPPWFLRSGDSVFQNLTTAGWDPTWSCNIVRSCGGALVALNVSKAGTVYPQMVKTSSIPLTGVAPVSWDITLPATLATENILAEMKSPIIDAQKLGNELVIYGLNEAWIMQADGSQFVYNYQKLPFQKGAINSNCSFELDGKHFVFGPDDIWEHDGTTAVSLVDGRNRSFIFNGMNSAKQNRCFISYNPQLKEMSFCYVSGDAFVAYLGAPDGCNRAAVYSVPDKTWSFDDLPLVFSSSNANLSIAVTYATILGTYATVGSSYQDQEAAYRRAPVFVGTANAQYSLTTQLYAQDLGGVGSTVVFPVDAAASGPRTLIRNGIDLDSLQIELRGYKVLSTMYPQGRFGFGSAPLVFTVGSADYFNVPPLYGTPQSYDGNTNYKLDFNTAGRYLSMTITHADYRDVTLSGFDLDLHVDGHV